jgi:hypothetical protein
MASKTPLAGEQIMKAITGVFHRAHCHAYHCENKHPVETEGSGHRPELIDGDSSNQDWL